jgi:hypothetical protein
MCGVYTFGFLIYGLVNGVHGDASSVAQWPYLMTATGLAFFFIYWRVIVIRKKEIAGYTFVGGPKYGLCVNFGDYKPGNGEVPADLVAILRKTADGWTKAGWTSDQINNVLTSDYIWIDFKPGSIDLPANMGKVAGYTIAYSHRMIVGYNPGATFEQTAFAHELGHIIQGCITNDWDMATHHARSKQLGLP